MAEDVKFKRFLNCFTSQSFMMKPEELQSNFPRTMMFFQGFLTFSFISLIERKFNIFIIVEVKHNSEICYEL